jgi:hypothetical protein
VNVELAAWSLAILGEIVSNFSATAPATSGSFSRKLYEALRLDDDTTQKDRTALCDALPLRAIGLEPSNITCSSPSSKILTSILRSHSPVTHHTIAFQVN